MNSTDAIQQRRKRAESSIVVYLLSALIGVAFAITIFTPEMLAGHGAFWANPEIPDAQQSVAGGRYFLRDLWRFPLFQTVLILPPHGVSIVFTDSIPLAALVAKIYATATGASGFYFGYWILCCYVFQAVGFVYLCRSLGATGLIPSLCAAVVALSIPEFIHRFDQEHFALCGQFIILFQLGLYFTNSRAGTAGRNSWKVIAVCLAALLIHFYCFVMCAGIFAVWLIQQATQSRSKRITAFRQAAIFIVLGVAVGLAAGYGAGSGSSAGYGYFSMNILSPWMPQKSGLFPNMGGIIDSTGGQYEGFNYLGMGVFLLLATAIIVSHRDIPRLLKKYRWLVAFLALSTMFAISDRAYVGGYAVFGHPMANAIADQLASTSSTTAPDVSAQHQQRIEHTLQLLKAPFDLLRASGRFFWPVAYCLAAFGVAVVVRRLSPRVASVLLVAAAILQFVDASPLRAEIEGKVRDPGPPALPTDLWERLIAAHDSVRVLPTTTCAGPYFSTIVFLTLRASVVGTPTRTAYLAHGSRDNCKAELDSVPAQSVQGRELLIILSPPVPLDVAETMPDAKDLCRQFSAGLVCSRTPHLLDEAGFARLETP